MSARSVLRFARVDGVRSMEPEAAAAHVRRAFGDPRAPKTVADAAVQSGLALRDAEAGLTWLLSEYRGHLRVTEDGELLYFFPDGFEQPWRTRDRLERIGSAIAAGTMGVLRFLVRAWLLIALTGYALVFLAILIGLSTQRSDRDDRRGGDLAAGLFRALFEAFYWTFHPFSPFAMQRHAVGRGRARDDVPLYEKVNRFVFGPSVAAEDPHAQTARILEQIRIGKGRIGLADVLRVTGLPRDRADALMARLMLDYEGDVFVDEHGGIGYRFEALRKTAEAEPTRRSPPAAWERSPPARPLTGNSLGSNLLIALVNGFNLGMSAWLLGSGFTVADLFALLHRDIPRWAPTGGLPWALGIVPLALSLLVFAVPAFRALARPRQEAKRARERGRLALLREVLTRTTRAEPVREDVLVRAYRDAAGHEPTDAQLRERIVELGGDVDLEGGEPIRYRFPELELEAHAVAEERELASEDEERVGAVIFRSDT